MTIAILVNTPDQAETLLHGLERAVAGIGLYVNAHKTEHQLQFFLFFSLEYKYL